MRWRWCTIPERSEALKRAQKKYAEKVSRVEITMTPEKKQRIVDHVAETGESVNAFINRAIDESIDRKSQDNKPD